MDYGLVFLGAFLASAHCMGMCGCFAVLAGGGKPSWGQKFTSQGVYSLGRLFTYVFLGAVAGWAGTALTGTARGAQISSALSVVSGVLFVLVGLEVLGLWRRFGDVGRRASGWFTLGLAPLIRQFSGAGGAGGTFMTGVLTGFLPCGLVYAFALRAATAATPGEAMLTMLVFGSGTVPAMVATGLVGGMLTPRRRATMYRFAGVILLVLGSISIWRGRPLLADQPETQAAVCHDMAHTKVSDTVPARDQATGSRDASGSP